MPIRLPTFFALISFLLFFAANSSAQETASQVPEAAAPPLAAAESGTSASLDQHAFARRVLVQLAESERSARFASAYSMFIGGATAITAGLVADLAYDRGYGRVLWIVGAVTEVGGLVNLFFSRPFERMAVEAEGWSPSQLQSEWGRRASIAQTTRVVSGVAGLGLGVLVVAGGAGIAAGIGDMEREAKQDWTTALVVVGGAIMGGGLTSLLVESPFESSYRMAFDSEAKEAHSVKLRVAPTLGGAALSLRASF